jgi:hypothetical protein
MLRGTARKERMKDCDRFFVAAVEGESSLVFARRDSISGNANPQGRRWALNDY